MNEAIKVSFQPLTEADYPLLLRWLNEPHVSQWWGREISTIEHVHSKYAPRVAGEEPGWYYIFKVADESVGYIQCYWLKDYPEYADQLGIVIGDKTAMFDIFIGERKWIGRGIGTQVLRQFFKDYIFGSMQAQNCVVGPEETNTAAIKAYAKAGMKHIKTVRITGEPHPEYLMEIRVLDIDESLNKGSCT
jgi:aminoglycoside 6'-N-acetyltransferase